MKTGNLFADSSPPPAGERCETLLSHGNLVIERIISSSAIPLHEYVQPQDEWVALIQGMATLHVAGKPVELRAGDHLFLPAGVPHTVHSVSQGAVWLAVHLHPAPAASSCLAMDGGSSAGGIPDQ